MFDNRFPFPMPWTTNKKLIWLVGAVVGGVREVWKTVTGTLIHITDALASPMRKCEVSLEPIQDLHGQDAPYPAGGGKNKFPNIVWEDNPAASKPNSWSVNGSVITLSKLASNTATMTAGFDISLKAGVTYSLSVASIKLDNGVTLTTPNLSVVATDDSTQTFGSSWEGFTPNKDIAHIRLSLVYGDSNWQTATITNVQVEEGSSATPYSPYSNICPITGWTGCEVTRTGKNVLQISHYEGSGSWLSQATFPVLNTYVTRTATFSGSGQYTFTMYGIKNGVQTLIDGAGRASSFTRTDNVSNYDEIYVYGYSNDASNALSELGIIFSDTQAVNYEPYSGTTLSVTFPDSAGTVYGGTLDLVSGVLTVDRAYASLTGKTWHGNRSDTQAIEAYTSLNPLKKNGILNVIADKFKTDSFVNEPTYTIRGFADDSDIAVKIPKAVAQNYAELATWVDANDVHVCYELATPLTYQLTPQEISTLAGENNVWSNSNGDTTIIYKAQA